MRDSIANERNDIQVLHESIDAWELGPHAARELTLDGAA